MFSFNSILYLGVEGVALQLVLALELPGVHLLHRQLVLGSLEDLGLINLVKTASREVVGEVSGHCDNGCPLPICTKPCLFLLVGVVVNYKREPDVVYIVCCG